MAEVGGDEWLPQGWKVEVRVRKSGRKDRYYTDPASGYVFRSLKDIDRYLLTGKCERRAMKSKSNDVDEAPGLELAEDALKEKGCSNPSSRSKKGVQKPSSSRNRKKKPTSGGTSSNQKPKKRKILESPQTKVSDDFFIPDPDQGGLPNFPEIIDLVTQSEHNENATCLSVQEIAVLLGRQSTAHESGPSVGEQSMPNKTETGLKSSLGLPWEVICSDPCVEFAIKTLTGAIPLESLSDGQQSMNAAANPDLVQAND